MRCVFCDEPESVAHLFFDCCVARTIWECVAEVCEKTVGADFELVAKLWLHNKKFKALNVCTTATLWAIWKLRDEFIFQGTCWTGVRVLLQRIARLLRDWKVLSQGEDADRMMAWAEELERRSLLPPRLTWEGGTNRQGYVLSSSVSGNQVFDTDVLDDVLVPAL
jgi:hypothetical protein